MSTPHKHAAVIKAWADGAQVQASSSGDVWVDFDTPDFNPRWQWRVTPRWQWRVKPVPPQAHRVVQAIRVRAPDGTAMGGHPFDIDVIATMCNGQMIGIDVMSWKVVNEKTSQGR